MVLSGMPNIRSLLSLDLRKMVVVVIRQQTQKDKAEMFVMFVEFVAAAKTRLNLWAKSLDAMSASNLGSHKSFFTIPNQRPSTIGAKFILFTSPGGNSTRNHRYLLVASDLLSVRQNGQARSPRRRALRQQAQSHRRRGIACR